MAVVMSKRGLTLLFLMVLLLTIGNMEMAEGRGRVRMCKTPSSKFRGLCLSSTNCKNVCRTEGFPTGDCDFHVASRKCYCYKPCI